VIHLEGVEDTSSCPSETRIPENLLNNDVFFEAITKQIRKDISDRLEIIVEKPIIFDYKNCFTFGHHLKLCS
jgi:hypothetical protein